MKVYLIGSLRNPEVPKLANQIRELGFEVFDDWYAAGPEADDKWRDYEKQRGHTYKEALKGYAANHVFKFDKKHLDECDVAILYLPAGKSGHLELGYLLGQNKKGYILLDNPERWDVMYLFASGVFHSFEELEKELKTLKDQSKKLDGGLIDLTHPFIALDPALKPVASGCSEEEAKLKAHAAGCATPVIKRNY